MERLKDDEFQKKQAEKKAGKTQEVVENSEVANVPPQAPAHPCPLCRGAGREYSRRVSTWYLRCISCGHTWTEKPKPGAVEITYRTTEIRER